MENCITTPSTLLYQQSAFNHILFSNLPVSLSGASVSSVTFLSIFTLSSSYLLFTIICILNPGLVASLA